MHPDGILDRLRNLVDFATRGLGHICAIGDRTPAASLYMSADSRTNLRFPEKTHGQQHYFKILDLPSKHSRGSSFTVC